MHWKRFKALSSAQKHNEIYYILGLDIGNDSSSIAYFNTAQNTPEIIDLSGGYGRPSIPTVMQYIAETKEWVFGEYAILNRGAGREITLSALIARLGSHEYIDVDGKPVSVVTLLGIFIREIIGNVKNINPKAEIVGIVTAIPGYFSDQATDELTRAFQYAGYEKELIALIPDRDCVFCHHYLTQTPREERVLLIDYGSREVRGGVYHIIPQGDEIGIKSMSSLFDETIGTQRINESVCALFRDFYADNMKTTPRSLTKQTLEHIHSFVFQHKDILFQKNIRSRPVKLYFNFAYPPFQQTVTYQQTTQLINPYQQHFKQFIKDVLEKNLYENAEITSADIDTVLCVGGGFEMLWARDTVTALFPQSAVQFYKNAKIITAEGAAVIAALRLDAADGYTVVMEDKHQLREDIGLAVSMNARDYFIPLVERNAFWWQKHPPKTILLNTACDGVSTVHLAVTARDADGDTFTLARMALDGLPARPKGTTRLSVRLHFLSDSELTIAVKDCGFGELYPKTDYERTVTIHR